MDSKLVFVVDDDSEFKDLVGGLLQQAGHRVRCYTDGDPLLTKEIETDSPDCILLDIMLHGQLGLGLCRELRSQARYNNTKIIIVSAKPYEFDRKRAIDLGADGYFVKPIRPDQFVQELHRIFQDPIELTFWGVRGTLPRSGADSVRYGGNTNCISLQFSKGPAFIFDAGTGLKVFSDHLMQQRRFPMEAKLFVSHPHWDHINGLPFFVPLYMQGNEFEIFGTPHGHLSTREIISAQMDGVYFPIKIKEFGARVYFRDITEGTVSFNYGPTVHTMLLMHPGNCLGYRVEYRGRVICYITDNELYPSDSVKFNSVYYKQLLHFIRSADALIIDSTYTEAEYSSKIDWGHSSIKNVVELAHRGEVKGLYLYHHDPDQNDVHIDKKLEQAKQLLVSLGSKTACFAPHEKQLFVF
ncbi:MAG: response regulator [Magnetococcales bacterium]|nr:response regulator [Magnetococcales bacterium]